ncbi:MAG: hypothetical protein ACRD10_13710 [Terriglobia bacterium]
MKTFAKAASGAIVASLLLCGMTFAKSSNVNFLYRAQVGSHLTLAPGAYKVVVNNRPQATEASFYKDGQLAGKVPVRLVSEGQKISRTEIYYGAPSGQSRPVTEIEINGWKNKLVFGNS